MDVLVTGGAGYVGAHVVVALLDAGRDVLVADDFSTGRRDVVDRIAEAARGRRPRVIEVDVTDREALDRALAGRAVGAVIHAAGSADVVGVTNVRESLAGVPFVLSSSASVYGVPWRSPVEEHDACAPDTVDGVATFAAERALQSAGDGSPVGILRYFHAVGAHPSGLIGRERVDDRALMTRLEQAAVGDAPSITMMGCDYPTRDGTALRDYVHVVDIAEAHVLALDALASRGASFVLNLGSPRGCTVREAVAAFEASVGRRIVTVAGPRREGDPPELWASAARAQALLGWRPRRSLVQACNDALRWRRHRTASPLPDGRRPAVAGRAVTM
jgi:UDP-glucose 4-epimerase